MIPLLDMQGSRFSMQEGMAHVFGATSNVSAISELLPYARSSKCHRHAAALWGIGARETQNQREGWM